MPKISVIVPVFNAEKTLLHCSRSILNQTFSDFEVIFVNDGSTDNSSKVLRSIQDSDTRVKVFHQINKGTGEARNYGLKESRADYICFVDSDDSIEPNMLDEMVKANDNCDMVVCDYQEVSEDGLRRLCTYNGSFDREGYMKAILNFRSASPVWAKLFHKNLFYTNNCFFPKGIRNNEDNALLFKLIYFTKNITFISKPLYCWNRGKESKSRVITALRLQETIDVLVSRKKFLEQYGLFEQSLADFYAGVIYTLSLRKKQIEKFTDPNALSIYLQILYSSLLKSKLINRDELSTLRETQSFVYWQFIFFVSDKNSAMSVEFENYFRALDWQHALNCQADGAPPEILSLKYFAERVPDKKIYVFGVGDTWQRLKVALEKAFAIAGFIDRSFSETNSDMKYDLNSVFEVMEEKSLILVASINQVEDMVTQIREHRLYESKMPVLITFVGLIND